MMQQGSIVTVIFREIHEADAFFDWLQWFDQHDKECDLKFVPAKVSKV